MISGILGLPGAGKSVFLAKAVSKALQGKPLVVAGHQLHDGRYDNILTNFPMRGCCRLDFDSLGVVNYENCLFICDEISLLADSRNYKTFSEDAKFFFSQHRKGGNTFLYCAQDYMQVEKRIRNLTDGFYYIQPARFFPSKLSTITPIEPYFDVKNMSNGYDFSPRYSVLYLPKYWKMFDSFAYINKQPTEIYVPQFWDCSPVELKK